MSTYKKKNELEDTLYLYTDDLTSYKRGKNTLYLAQAMTSLKRNRCLNFLCPSESSTIKEFLTSLLCALSAFQKQIITNKIVFLFQLYHNNNNYKVMTYREHRFSLNNIEFIQEMLSHIKSFRQHGVIWVAGWCILYKILQHIHIQT